MTDRWAISGDGFVLAISGGIGGAKLALGLYRVLGPDRLTVLANTGDDFDHLGMHISPDLDTLMYTLAGINDPDRGWGHASETWNFMQALGALGGESWFSLGDRDLATHVERSHLLAQGWSLTAVTENFCRRLGVGVTLLPMSEDPVRTFVETEAGALPFQTYFVQQRCAPAVTGFRFRGADVAQANPAVMDAMSDDGLCLVVVCPSNPYLSIDPILAVPGIREALAGCPAPVVAVSPIIGGAAVKGPTDKIMRELGVSRTNAAVAQHYHGLIDGLVVDSGDVASAGDLGLPVHGTRTLMRTLADRESLAMEVLRFGETLARHTVAERR